MLSESQLEPTRDAVAPAQPGYRPIGSAAATDRALQGSATLPPMDETGRILDHIPTAIACINTASDGEFTFLNRHFVRIFGYTLQDIPNLAAWSQQACIDDPRRHEWASLWRAGVAQPPNGPGVVDSIRARVRCKDGTLRDVLANTSLHEGQLLLSLVDITEHNLNEDRLRVLTTAIEQCPAAIMITNANGEIEYVNPSFSAVAGYALSEIAGKNPRVLGAGLTDGATFQAMWRQLARGEPWVGELVNRNKAGRLYWEEAHMAPVTDAMGAVTHYVAVKLDITGRKASDERIRHLAQFDALTDLPNRSLFDDRLRNALQADRRRASRIALLYVDLDHFKPINDTYGHAVGDMVLQEAARRLSAALRQSDTVGRIGGDEFVVLLTEVVSAGMAVKVAEKILASMREPIQVNGLTLRISCSIGVAMPSGRGSDALELYKHADAAMYQAKNAGRDTIHMYAFGSDADDAVQSR